ncbi:MAG: hypothetical protein LUD16_12835 [Lachnospiraceae bacterium]|nr:hypothetical protein [Lachnospiraceae bacterium]
MSEDLKNLIGGAVLMDENGQVTSQVNSNLYRVEVIAQLFGVTVRRIQQLTQEGVISTTKAVEDGRTVRRYDLVPTIQKYIKYLSDKAYGKTARTDKEIELREQKMEADIALKESQGELHRLKTEIAAGKYISVEEVKIDYEKFFVNFNKFAMSLPSRIIGSFSGQIEPLEARRIEKEIASEINLLLNSFVVAGIVEPKDVKGINDGAKKKVAEEIPDN